ncbi:MAG: hypothetical protein FGM57_03485 [Candidatus Taylorbacteria bacterium]|nr:hypothetical protein [Candidatus Taylorbacteria bacterium]
MKLIRSLTLALGLAAICAPAAIFAADKPAAKPRAGVEETISSLKSSLDATFEKILKDAHTDILGKHKIVTTEKVGEKTCVLTKLGDHQYLAYVPEGSIAGISAIDYRWIPHAGLLVMPIDKAGADMKSAAYFDFLLTGFDPKVVSEHVTTASSSGAISVPLRTATVFIGESRKHVTMLKP